MSNQITRPLTLIQKIRLAIISFFDADESRLQARRAFRAARKRTVTPSTTFPLAPSSFASTPKICLSCPHGCKPREWNQCALVNAERESAKQRAAHEVSGYSSMQDPERFDGLS